MTYRTLRSPKQGVKERTTTQVVVADKHFEALAGELEAAVFTQDRSDLSKAATVLARTLRKTFLADMTVCDVHEYTELGPSTVADIKKVAAEKGVRLKEEARGEWA